MSDLSDRTEYAGALVGWTHHDSGDHIVLRVESISSTKTLATKEVDISRLFMTKQQALLLGHYLLKLSGETVHDERSSWLMGVLTRRSVSRQAT